MDTRWYLDVNQFARDTGWAHGFMSAYALWAGVAVLAVLILLSWWSARRDGARAVAAVVWTGVAAVIALALNQPLIHLVGRVRPYDVLRGVEVLVPRAHDFTFPSDHATVAGAVVCGLFIARRRVLAPIALFVGLLLLFARVYVGAHYPSDVVAGALFGAAVTGVLAPLALWVLVPIVNALARTPLRPLVLAGAASSSGTAGPVGEAPPEHVQPEEASAAATGGSASPATHLTSRAESSSDQITRP